MENKKSKKLATTETVKAASTVVSKLAKKATSKIKKDGISNAVKNYESAKKNLGSSLGKELDSINRRTKETVCKKVDRAREIQKIAKETGNSKAEKRASKIVEKYGGDCSTS